MTRRINARRQRRALIFKGDSIWAGARCRRVSYYMIAEKTFVDSDIAANQCGATTLLSEDLHHGMVVEKVTISNPLLAG